jgi:hypothetical protein
MKRRKPPIDWDHVVAIIEVAKDTLRSLATRQLTPRTPADMEGPIWWPSLQALVPHTWWATAIAWRCVFGIELDDSCLTALLTDRIHRTHSHHQPTLFD